MATPQDIIDDARGYVADIQADAVLALMNAVMFVDASGGVNIAEIPAEFEIKGVTDLPEPPDVPDIPDLEIIDLLLPTAPGEMGTLDTIPTYAQQTAPVFGETAPTFTMPSLPAGLAEFRTNAPTITSVEFPEPPSELENPNLQPVVFGDHTAPDKMALFMPQLPGNAPAFNGTEPTNLADEFRANYADTRTVLSTLASSYVEQMISQYAPNHSAGMAAVESRLQTYLDGGTALAPEVEEAIFNRARARNDVEAKKVQDAAFADIAARGFTLPSGALASTLARARQEAANNANKTSNEIAVAQAELEQKNLQFALSTSAALRTTVLQLTNSWLQGMLAINGQALDTAKAIMSAVIEAYNTTVKVYMTRVEGWKTEVAMFDSKIKFELSKVEIYKAEIAALQAEYTVDQMKVDLYKAEVSRLMSLAELYKGRIQAVMGQVSLEKSKIDIFQAQVQAYSAQTQAKQAEWQGFSAQIGGQTASAQAYSARVSGYTAQVQAYKTDIEAKVAEMNAVIAKNQSVADTYKSRVLAYTAQVQAASTSNSANIETQRQKSTLYKARIDQNMAKYQMSTTYYKVEADRILEEAREKFNAASKKAELFLELSKVTGGIYERIGAIQGGMAQAALAGMNTLAASTETI